MLKYVGAVNAADAADVQVTTAPFDAVAEHPSGSLLMSLSGRLAASEAPRKTPS
jgi:hypothetical protein